jgi:hypothetical protein
MKLGTNDIGSVYLGTNAVQKVYLGTNEVWSSWPGYVLDDYPNAAAAYSLRLLRSAYTGSAIKVRRAVGSPSEKDIGFVNNQLDVADLESFCSGTNGFVVTWYDQSGNSRNATQTTAANQPQIVSSGSVIITNGKPAAQLDGVNDSLIFNSNLFLGASSRTILTVYKPNNSTGSFIYSIFGQSSSGSSLGSYTVLQSRTTGVSGDPYFAGFAADLGNGLSTPNTSQKLAQFNYNGTTGYLYKNNSLLTSGNITLNALSNGQIIIGNSLAVPSEFANANIQECIAWTSNEDANTSGISTNINSYYGIY